MAFHPVTRRKTPASQTLDPARSGRVCSWLHSVCTPGVQTECAGRGRVCRGCAPNVHGSTSFRGAWPRNVYPWTRRGRGCRRRVHERTHVRAGWARRVRPWTLVWLGRLRGVSERSLGRSSAPSEGRRVQCVCTVAGDRRLPVHGWSGKSWTGRVREPAGGGRGVDDLSELPRDADDTAPTSRSRSRSRSRSPA